MDYLGKINNRTEQIFGLLDKTKIASLDGLRGIAILMILNAHVFLVWDYFAGNDNTVYGKDINFMIHTVQAGNIGVELFFVLSGFLIYNSIKNKKPEFFQFMAHRYLRLLPIVLVIVVPMVLVSILNVVLVDQNGSEEKISGLFYLGTVLINNVTFLQIFKAPLFLEWMWVLVYEVYFYILAGILLIVLNNRITKSWPGFFLVSFAVLASQILPGSPIPQTSRFMGFFFGMAVAKLMEEKRVGQCDWYRHLWIVGIIGILILQIYEGSIPFDSIWQQSTAIKNIFFLSAGLCFGLLLLSALTEKNIIDKILSFASLRVIGIISYPFFMFNITIRDMAFSAVLFSGITGLIGMALVWCISFVGCVFISAFLWKHVENCFNPKKKGVVVLRKN